MKKISSASLVSAIFSLTIFACSYTFCVPNASASSFPSLTLSSNGSIVQAIVSNADPNATVTFFYPSGSSNASVNIGTTDSNGYLTAQINPGSYSISTGNPVYVRVNSGQSPTATWPSVSSGSSGSGVSLYLTQTSVSLNVGQSVNITASNVIGSLSVPGNSNPSAASASANGNIITVSGLANGTSAITVCASSSGCSTINVTVQPSNLTSPAIYLNPNSLNLSSGQSQTVSITGYASGPYYISGNTGSNAVSAAVSNSSLILTGLAVGNSNITVCATGGQCGTMFVNVSSGSASGNTGLPPVLSSVSISSSGNNNNNSFVSAGTAITISFTANQQVVNPQVRVNGSQILTNGSGAGPYTATYTVTGAESMPIPIVISFASLSGSSGQTYFWFGNSPTAPSVSSATITAVSGVQTPISQTPAPSGSYSFTKYLYIGMTKLGVSDPDVTALQRRLKADGIYSGPVTGYFGSQTKVAVETYQKEARIEYSRSGRTGHPQSAQSGDIDFMIMKENIRRVSIAALFLIPLFPLVVTPFLASPFITGQAFFFRILVEIAFTGWVILTCVDATYRPKWTPMTIAVCAFTLIVLVADLAGVDPLRSLWSNLERMEGWIDIVHLWALYMVMANMFDRRLWHRWLGVSLAVAAIVAVYGLCQQFGLAPYHYQIGRLDASFGNPTYLAEYLLAHIFIAGYLFFVAKRLGDAVVRPSVWRWAYPILAALFAFDIFETATRGAIIGLIVGILAALAWYAVFGTGESRKWRAISGGIVGFIVIIGMIFFLTRSAPIYQKNYTLSRLASISWSNTGDQARQYIWPIALKGIAERPILGWGQEDFNYVFNAGYDPAMYGQEQWFDRAHDSYLDWAIASGIVGLMAYLALYVLFLLAVWRSALDVPEKSVLIGLIAGYAVFNIFTFDTLASYVFFFALLAYANSLKGRNFPRDRLSPPRIAGR